MTTQGPRSEQDEKRAASLRAGSLRKRIWEWFWRGSALARARQALSGPEQRAAAFAQRARASAELAQSILAADEPGETSSEGSACELFRQASFWSLCVPLAKAEPAFQPDDSDRIWDTLDDALLVQLSSDEKRIEGLRSALRAGSFVDFAELPTLERSALLLQLRKLTRALLVELDERSNALDEIYIDRTWRLGLLGLLLLCVASSPVLLLWKVRGTSTGGTPWRASSQFGSRAACVSPAQECPDSPNLFFHTDHEASPWIEFDLGRNQKISKVRVDNRADCCADRADPLSVEISTDQEHWTEVARHDGTFTSWQAAFAPVHARYLRLRVLKQSYLHLAAVRIY